MFCLNCGNKIKEGQEFCDQCGMSVKEIESRIAEAQEKVIYAETVGPSKTEKLPPVAERLYYDKDGRPIRPEDEIDVSELTNQSDKFELPIIGDANDPFVTKPIQKVVSDQGEVLTSFDTDAKTYRQDPPKKQHSKKWIIILVVVVVLVLVGVFVGMQIFNTQSSQPQANDQTSQQQAQQDETSQQDKVGANTAAQGGATQNDERKAVFDSLSSAYAALGSFRQQVSGAVSDFEGYYLVSNKQTRTDYATKCSQLSQSIQDEKDKLTRVVEDSGLPQDDALRAQYSKIDELYSLLLTRLAVIQSCWDVSLSFDSPKEHSEEILANLSQDIKSGQSSSEAAFDELYPQASPVY